MAGTGTDMGHTGIDTPYILVTSHCQLHDAYITTPPSLLLSLLQRSTIPEHYRSTAIPVSTSH